ncbi:MAG: molybdenum cofactor guanylyltransferase [Acidobacteriales bacterium]|nr:molybdenum cofactor guanylyltransferase [Terriglobales bacterium]
MFALWQLQAFTADLRVCSAGFMRVMAYVLAGGLSSRMGQDKSQLRVGGRTMLEHAREFVGTIASETAVVGSQEHLGGYAEVVRDVWRQCGPLGGIHAALAHARSEWNLIFAVDQFWRDPGVLRLLCDVAHTVSAECWAVVPQIDGRAEPLCALYRKAFGAAAEEALRRGERKIGRLLTPERTRWISEEEMRVAGVSPEVRNVNTPEDYAELMQDWGASNKP